MGDETRRTVSRAQWLRRLASRGRNKTAFVLSGGGPYAALQVGALGALFEREIVPELVVGTSAGALNAGFLACDPTTPGVMRLEAMWRSLEDEDLFPGVRFKTSWARMVMRGDKVFDNSGIRRLIETRLGSPRFEDTRIPLGIVATDLQTGDEAVFTTGDMTEPLVASCAMPGIFPPVTIAGRSYIDGGVSNAVPVLPAIAMGAKTVYVLNCAAGNQRPRPLIRPMDHLLHAFALTRGRRWELELPVISQKVEVVVVPTPTLNVTVPFTSMAHTDQLIELGYEAAARFLDGGTAVAEVTALPTS